MKSTDYFEQKIIERGIKREWVDEALANEAGREIQPDGRTKIWGWVEERGYYLRVVLLEDGETLLNAMLDRNYTNQRGWP